MEEKYKSFNKYYEFSMAFLALIVSLMIVIEFTFELSKGMIEIFNVVDTVISIIFSSIPH